MACADFRRADENDLTSERHSGQVTSHARRACNLAFRPDKHARDVFDKDEPRAAFVDDAARVGPQVAFVVCSLASAGVAVGLARDAANDAIHKAAPRSAPEGGHISPHRRVSQVTLLHRLDQSRAAECFPLHVTDRASVWHCQLEAEIKPGASAAEADGM